MGRIDDALRRSGASDRLPSTTSSKEDVFVSPWSVPTVPDVQPIEGATATTSDLTTDSEAVAPRELVADRVDLLTGSSEADPALSGQFRRMAARLYNTHQQDEANLKVVMVTSAVPAEGKTTTAINLALILSESFQEKVLLIDADLRRPSLHRAWGISEDRGLSDALRPLGAQELALVRVGETLTVLPAGPVRQKADPVASAVHPGGRFPAERIGNEFLGREAGLPVKDLCRRHGFSEASSPSSKPGDASTTRNDRRRG